MTNIIIAPCPFCGSDNVMLSTGLWCFVECKNEDCGATGPRDYNELKAVDLWNAALRRGDKLPLGGATNEDLEKAGFEL